MILLCASLVANSVVCGQPDAAPAAAPTQAPTQAYVQWVGPDSQHPPGFVLVSDDTAWRSLWAAHTGKPDVTRHGAPKIDFGRCMVVAHFRGPSTNHDGEVLTSIDVGKDVMRIRYESSSFQTASFDGPGGAGARGGAVDTTPYGIWVVPRRDAAVVVERRAQGLKSDPVRWVEAHRFPRR